MERLSNANSPTSDLTLMFQKSRVLQIQGVKGKAVVIYREPLTTQEMQCHPAKSGKGKQQGEFL